MRKPTPSVARGVSGQGDIDPAVEQVAADCVKVIRICERYFDDRQSGPVGRGDVELFQTVQHAGGLAVEAGADRVPAFSVHLEPSKDGGQGGHRRGPGIQVGRGSDLEDVLQAIDRLVTG